MNLNSLKAKLIFGFLLSIIAMTLLIVVDIYSVHKANDALAYVYENQMQPAMALEEMDSDIKEIRFRMAGVLLDQMPTAGSRNQIKEVRGKIGEDWENFKKSTSGNQFDDKTQEQITKIDKQIALLPAFLDKLDSAYATDQKPLIAPMLEDEWPAFQGNLIKPISLLLPEQQLAVKKTFENSKATGQRLILIGLAVFGIGITILLVGIKLLSSDIHLGIQALKDTLDKVAQGDLTAKVPIKRKDELGEMGQSLENTTTHLKLIVEGVKRAADTAANSSSNLSHQIEQVISRGAVRNERVMHVAAAMEEISVANSEVANSALDAGEAVHRNEEYARQSDESMGKNRAAMEKVVTTVHNSVSIVSNLNDSIQKIGQITTVIKEIAEQTNLLALNAAIEAARAGEQGRGFAVVADEVRKLAERTSISTREISGVVESIRTETEAVVTSMSEVEREVEESASFNLLTGDALKKIVEAANHVTGLVGHIAESTKEQTTATDDVARSMEEISALTAENSTNIRQVGQSADDVSNIASELQQLVGQFQV